MSKHVLRSGLSRDIFPIGETRRTVLNQSSKEALRLPFYWMLPADPVECLKWKIYCRERCMVDPAFRDNILYMCEQDVAFFAETFCMIFEPRPNPRLIPCKLWLDQVDLLAWAEECYGKRDMGVEKSRGIGVSWLFSIFYYHKFRFHARTKLAVLSKGEKDLDGPDEQSFMGKIALLHENMPAWFRLDTFGRDIMKRSLTEHIMLNKQNNASIMGFPPTNDNVRSLRFTSLFNDEFAFLPRNVQAQMNAGAPTTPNRFFVSTWNGSDNEFHVMMRLVPSSLLRCEAYWWNNYERWQGAYQFENGRLNIIDKDYVFPPDYPFNDDGLLRSPWIDFELSRAGSRVASALEEYYGIKGGEGRKLLRSSSIAIAKTMIKAPERVGHIEMNGNGEYVFRDDINGPVYLWGNVGEGRMGPFSAGSDIGWGRDASSSTFEVIDIPTGRQVMSICVADLAPIPFAQYCWNALQFLNGEKGDGHTYYTFENNAEQGNLFGGEMVRLGYGNIMQNQYKGLSGTNKNASYLGMRNLDRGMGILGELERAIVDGEVTPLCEELVTELELFDKDEDGKVVFPRTAKGHGDRAIGFAMAWFQARNRREPESVTTDKPSLRETDFGPEKKKSWSDAWKLTT